MAIRQPIEEKVNDLENAIRELVYLNHKNEMQIQQLSVEMKEFKDEMRAFKDEMKVFKDEMLAFKDEMKVFKDEMLSYKDDTKDFKHEMLSFKDEMREENRRMNKQWGELSNKMGTIVEDLIYPSVHPLLLRYFELEPIETSIRIRRKKGALSAEFDAIAVCEHEVFLFEVKASPRKEYVDEFLERQIPLFRSLFPEHREKNLVPIFASIRIEDPILEYCTHKQVYAMAYREWDYMDLLNFEELKSSRKD